VSPAGLTILAISILAALTPSAALADSASISAVDAGGGTMKVVADITSTSCSTSGYCGWFAFAVERHASLPCREDDGFLTHVGSLRETSGTSHEEWTYEPFFPREDKICVLVSNGAGVHPVGEAVISLPTGYGRQRSSAHNCSFFSSQERAQYYLELYPDDPSGLDGDDDGVACEANACPCGAEAIPPEPAPPSPPAVPFVSTGPDVCAEGHHHLEVAWQRVGEARRRFQRSRGTRSARRKHQALVRRIREARQTEQQQIELCGSP
jgi:Excalibur calcium-binding domain